MHAPLPTLTAEAAEQANKFHFLGPLRFQTLFVEAPSLQLSLDLLDSKLDGISLMKHIMFLRVHELKWLKKKFKKPERTTGKSDEAQCMENYQPIKLKSVSVYQLHMGDCFIPCNNFRHHIPAQFSSQLFRLQRNFLLCYKYLFLRESIYFLC